MFVPSQQDTYTQVACLSSSQAEGDLSQTLRREATPCRKREATPHRKAVSDPLQAVQEAIEKLDLTPNAGSLATRHQTAAHVNDPTAADYRDQGNVQPLELDDLDRFIKFPTSERNNRPGSCK